ncbi:MAG: type III-B CRISPR module RAMP protein Cmr1 [Candidatus Thorarchaeota archaeon]|nr:type III-B CRISPR module RAMP protein Cmr1 [Candidatus Thorarchaeota archaeon]
MDRAIFKLTSVTPTFIAGADQRIIEDNPLRPTSLKGLMRWWFRAIKGGAIYSSSSQEFENVTKEENRIWGSTRAKSKIIIRVKSPKIKKKRNIKEKTRRNKGIKYLTYGIENRPYIDIDSNFELELLYPHSLSAEEKNKIESTIWLLFNLGNVGAKSRKGFGSFMVSETENLNSELEFENPNDCESLVEYLETNIRECFKIFEINEQTTHQTLPAFPIISPNYWKLKIIDQVFESAFDAIDFIGSRIRSFREDPKTLHTRRTRKGKEYSYRTTKDYTAVRAVFQTSGKSASHTHKTPKGSIFGLPHQFQFQSIGKKAIVQGKNTQRRASPLLVKIWKLEQKKYVVGVQLFKSEFISEGELKISNLYDPEQSIFTGVPTFDYLEDFLGTLDGEEIRV